MTNLTTNPKTRQSLLIRLRNPRDDQAWTEFAAVYEPVIYHLANQRGLQDADAREVVQEVLMSVTKAIDRFDANIEGTFRGWLSRITRNATIDHLRRRSKYDQSLGMTQIQSLMEQCADSDTELAEAFDLERRQQLFRWAAKEVRLKTGEKNWMAFWKSSVEGHSISATADELAISEGAVYVARCRILKRIRELVHERLDD